MEESEFFTELCQLALSIDRNVRFAGVVYNNGRLLTGKYRNDIKSPLFNSTARSDVTNNLFYASYRSVALTRTFETSLGSLKYQLSEFDDVKLLTVPLTIRGDRFLCVLLDPMPSCQMTVTKLMDNI
ncbi:hypothetical protein [Nitrososphaera sp.]|uniref:hypothetical protein n=1 Tax=Nitrososphaera sp. TaxID=1971748 RepID=UPI002EDB5607